MSESYHGKLCPHCLETLRPGVEVVVCPRCGVPHHRQCWQQRGRCTTRGCSGAAEQETPLAPAMPVSPPAAPPPTTPVRTVQPLAMDDAPPSPAPAADPSLEIITVTSPDRTLESLLAEIFLRIREERFAEVVPRLAKAKELAPDHPSVLEAEGDLAFARRQYRQAGTLYQRAFQITPGQTGLEEKYALALVKASEPALLAKLGPDDESPWGTLIQRPFWASGLLSSVFPGLGQFYNGEWVKGLIFGVAAFILDSILAGFLAPIFKKGTEGGKPILPTWAEFCTALVQPWHLVVIALILVLWVFSIVEAILTARQARSAGLG